MATSAKRMATSDSPGGEPETSSEAKFLESFRCIMGTTRLEPTCRSEKARKPDL